MYMIRCAGKWRSVNYLLDKYSTRWMSSPSLQEPKTFGSHLKTKLKYFIESGQVIKYTPEQSEKRIVKQRTREAIESLKKSYSLQKALLILKSKYDNHCFQYDNGEKLSLEKLAASDLKLNSSKSLVLFKNLINIKKINKKPVDNKLLLSLLGTNNEQIKDPYLVTKDVLKLLERDKEITRAVYLAKLAGAKSGVVGMNAVLQWLLETGDIKSGLKNFNDRKKWGIPSNEQTYVIFFDGLSKAHEWGKATNELSEKCVHIFENFRSEILDANKQKNALKCNIEHFNACLSLLVKNFNDEQQLAWSFFDLVIPDATSKLPVLIPNSQTFTILLNGVKKFSNYQSEMIINDNKLTSNDKTLKLLEVQGRLVSTAELILSKVIEAATPPNPPTKEEVKVNPDLLIEYRAKMRRRLIDIDQTFVSVFISCFINDFSGTGVDINSGSHYKYIQHGLNYLNSWSSEIGSLFDFIGKVNSPENLIKPLNSIKSGTDLRIKKSIEYFNDSNKKPIKLENDVEEILPENLIKPLDKSKINPLVIFPPSPFSRNKTKAIFSGKQKRLVDFSRPLFSDIRLLLLDKQYKDSKGKFGKKLPEKSNITLNKRNGTNKFLLSLTLNGLVKLGKFKEFYIAIWYILNKWGGICINRDEVLNNINENGISKGVLKDHQFPKFLLSNEEKEEKLHFLKQGTKEISIDRKKVDYNEEIVDIMLIENCIYKINENFKQNGKSSTNLIIEILSGLINTEINTTNVLKPRFKTFDIIFSCLIKDLHYFNDHNYNKLLIDKKAKGIPNNSPKKSINNEQLSSFLDNLNKFVNSLLVNELSAHKNLKYLLPNKFIESYNKIIERVYNTTWIEIDESQIISNHKQIIKSGILFYKPKNLIVPSENLLYSTPILTSIELLYKKFKESEQLNQLDARLMNSFKQLFQLDSSDDKSLNKLESLTRKIYDLL